MESAEEVTFAFSTKWLWAWCEMHGYKRVECRSVPFPPFLPRTGRIAVHMASRYSRAQYAEDLDYIRGNWTCGEKVYAENPGYDELSFRHGLIVGTVAYSVRESDPCCIDLRDPVWLKRFVRVRGSAGWWRLPADVRRLVAECRRQSATSTATALQT